MTELGWYCGMKLTTDALKVERRDSWMSEDYGRVVSLLQSTRMGRVRRQRGQHDG